MSKRQRTGVNSYVVPEYGGYTSAFPYQLFAPVRGGTLDIAGSGLIEGDLTVTGQLVSNAGTAPDTFGALSCTSFTDSGACSLQAGLACTGLGQFSGGAPSLKSDTLQVTGAATMASLVTTGAGTLASLHVAGTSALDGTVTCGSTSSIVVPTSCTAIDCAAGGGTVSMFSAGPATINLSAADAGTLALGGTSGCLIRLGGSGTSANVNTVSCIQGSGAGQFLVNSVGGGPGTITIGNTTGPSTSSIMGTTNINTVGSRVTSIGSATGGTTTTMLGTLNLGAASQTQAISIGNTVGTPAVNIAGVIGMGTSGDTSTISIGTGASGRAINIGHSSGTPTTSIAGALSVGTDSDTSPIVIGTGGITRPITIGTFGNGTTTLSGGTVNSQAVTTNINATNAATTTIQSGVGPAQAGQVNLCRGAGNTLAIGVATVGTLPTMVTDIAGTFQWNGGTNSGNDLCSLGSLAATTINIGNTTGPSVTSLFGTINVGTDAGTRTISVGTAGTRTINLGNTSATTNFVTGTSPTLFTNTSARTPLTTTSVYQGYGALGLTYTPRVTGKVLIIVNCYVNTATTSTYTVGIYTGTGTAPVAGANTPGTGTLQGLAFPFTVASGTNALSPLSAVVTGLTLGTAMWVDLGAADTSSGGHNDAIEKIQATICEIL